MAPVASRLSGPSRGAVAILVEVGRIAREMLVIPVQLWLVLAELAGRAVLAVWLFARPLLFGAIALLVAAVRLAQREITPARALTAVALSALVALVASQWVDYRGVSVGTADYAGEVETVAPAPDVDRERAGEAHAWIMLPIAGAAAAVLVVALRGRWRVARLLVPLGLAVIAISVVVDAPRGLDADAAAIAYEGAEARLLEGFWSQVAAAAVLSACGLMLPARLRPGTAAARRRSRAGGRRAGEERVRGSSGLAKPPIEGTSA